MSDLNSNLLSDKLDRIFTSVTDVKLGVASLESSVSNMNKRLEKVEHVVEDKAVRRDEMKALFDNQNRETTLKLEAVEENVKELQDYQTWIIRGSLTAFGALFVAMLTAYLKQPQ